MNAIQNKVIFIYDLPANNVTSAGLAQLIKQLTKYDLRPTVDDIQIRRDPSRKLRTAVIKIDDPAAFEQAVTKLRYYNYAGQTPIRALPYIRELTGQNIEKIQTHNIFVRKIPKEGFGSKQLDEAFNKFGEILSCKVSITDEYESRGFGFVCFKDPEAAQRALEATKANESLCTVKFNPKLKSEARKAFNTIFVKDVPPSHDTVEGVISLFTPYGTIASHFHKQTPKGNIYFICFGNNTDDREYGPRCAEKALAEMHEKLLEGADKKLYVAAGMKKKERERAIEHEAIKFKLSKKRCNLFVKNFPDDTTEENLTQLFQNFGQIESLRIFYPNQSVEEQKMQGLPLRTHGNAFVCFTTPDSASLAKQANLQIQGRQLYVNYYEIKSQREIRNEQIRDQQDFAQYQANVHGYPLALTHNTTEQMLKLITSLVAQMGGPMGQQQSQIRALSQPQRPRVQDQSGYQGQQQVQQDFSQYPQRGRGGNFNQRPRPQYSQGGPQQQPRQPPPVVNQAPTPMAPMVNFAFSADPSSHSFYTGAQVIVMAVNINNPIYKNQVGSMIYDFVKARVGEKAPKITGMLIDLPCEEIVKFLTNFDLFNQRVKQADDLLKLQEAQQAVAH